MENPFRRTGTLTEQTMTKNSVSYTVAAEYYDFLETLPPCREVSLAKTKLEEAVHWAEVAILTQDLNAGA